MSPLQVFSATTMATCNLELWTSTLKVFDCRPPSREWSLSLQHHPKRDCIRDYVFSLQWRRTARPWERVFAFARECLMQQKTCCTPSRLRGRGVSSPPPSRTGVSVTFKNNPVVRVVLDTQHVTGIQRAGLSEKGRGSTGAVLLPFSPHE